MNRKIIALFMSAAIMMSAAAAASAETLPVQTATVTQEYAAAATVWDGKTAMKSGKNYIINSNITISKKFYVPDNSTLTIKSGSKFTVSSKGALTVKGTLKVQKNAVLSVSGKLTLNTGKTIIDAGKITFGSKAAVVLNGKLTVSKTGTISGKPASLSLGSKANVSIAGKNSCAKLTTALDKRDIRSALNSLYKAALVDGDICSALKNVFTEEYLAKLDETLKSQGTSLEEYCKKIDAEITSSLTSEKIGKVTSASASLTSLKNVTNTIDDADKLVVSEIYPDFDKVYKAVGKLTLNKDKDGGTSEILAVRSGGKWYICPTAAASVQQ